MIYIIENSVLFNMDENAFTLLEDSAQKITISNPARRILALLIEQHGTVVLRETLFQKVWDDYGLISNNNNLNQCISKLRKIISSLGIKSEFIVTIPKIGFLIKRETNVQVYLGSETLELPVKKHLIADVTTHEAGLTNKLLTPPVSSKKKWSKKTSLLIYGLISLMFCLLSLWVIITFGRAYTPDNYFVADVGECRVYSPIPISVNDNEKVVDRAKAFISEKNVDCKSDDIILFQMDSIISSINTGSLRVFMAKCEVNKNNRIKSCISYYRNDRTFDEKH